MGQRTLPTFRTGTNNVENKSESKA